MENDGNQDVASSLCKAGCGFFGNQQFDGMCSKCFKDSVKRKQATTTDSSSHVTASSSSPVVVSAPSPLTGVQVTNIQVSEAVAAAAAASAASSLPNTTPCVETGRPTIPAIDADGSGSGTSATDSGASGSEETDGMESPQKGKGKRNRCYTCKKRVGLTGFECRCGGVYCSTHRYSDKHACEFDYKELGADHIRKNNPVVVGQKVQKL